MKHVITALAENKPGVLARIVGVISGRGFNIETINAGPTHDPSLSRITLTVPGDDRVLEQVTKQLQKLVDVITVTDLTREPYLNRELLLVEVASPPRKRAEVVEVAGLAGAQVVSVQPQSLILQIAAEQERVEDFLRLLGPYRIVNLARTGVMALPKARQAVPDPSEQQPGWQQKAARRRAR
ncbi:MAG: acetolactate synthase small subunit [Kiritimatiellae bacterium]|nr:acetolactate synthase small subunit [Kiritimatiellia bacterium]